MHKILFAERTEIGMNWGRQWGEGGGLMGLESWTVSKGGERDWQLNLLHWRLQWNIVALVKAASQSCRQAGRELLSPQHLCLPEAFITNTRTKTKKYRSLPFPSLIFSSSTAWAFTAHQEGKKPPKKLKAGAGLTKVFGKQNRSTVALNRRPSHPF